MDRARKGGWAGKGLKGPYHWGGGMGTHDTVPYKHMHRYMQARSPRCPCTLFGGGFPYRNRLQKKKKKRVPTYSKLSNLEELAYVFTFMQLWSWGLEICSGGQVPSGPLGSCAGTSGGRPGNSRRSSAVGWSGGEDWFSRKSLWGEL